MTKFEIEWEGYAPSLGEDDFIKIKREIEHISESLEKASDLIFHTIFLTDDASGPTVMVDGKEEVDNTLFLTYYSETKWLTLDELGDE